jgi:hypothetical protein
LSSVDRTMPRTALVGRPGDGEMAGQGDDVAGGCFLRFRRPTDGIPEEAMTIDSPDRNTVLRRVVPLAGVLYAGLIYGGDLVIGPLPDGETPAASVQRYYAAHADHVAIAGTLIAWGAVCFAVFGAAVWWQLRRSAAPALLGAVVLAGAVLEAGFQAATAATYDLLGRLAGAPGVDPATVQSWHLVVAELGGPVGPTLVLLGIAAAAIGYRALPRWLGWAALVLAAAEWSPWGFLASMVFLVWAAVAGVTLAVRGRRPATRLGEAPIPVGRPGS